MRKRERERADSGKRGNQTMVSMHKLCTYRKKFRLDPGKRRTEYFRPKDMEGCTLYMMLDDLNPWKVATFSLFIFNIFFMYWFDSTLGNGMHC